MKFAFIEEERNRCWIIEADDKHIAIAKAVEAGFQQDMESFYYGLSDGQISVIKIEKEIT